MKVNIALKLMLFVQDDEFFIKIYYQKPHKIVKVKSMGRSDAAAVELVAKKKTDLNYCLLFKIYHSEDLIKMMESGTANL
jgi:uncharacterized membrane protein (UPF0127 family)